MKTINKINIFLADDHTMFRDGLKFILTINTDYVIVGEAANGKEAIDKIEQLHPDLVILDISMPEMTGIEVARQVRKYYPEIKIIILSRHDSEEYVNQVVKYGVHGYILKENASNDLHKAITEVMKGNLFLSSTIMTKIIIDYSKDKHEKAPETELNKSLFATLSNREIEIIKLIAEGKSSKEIASLKRITNATVKVHRANIMGKLNVHKSTDLVKYAIKAGLVDN